MITVYKYPFTVSGYVELDLPEGARVLKIETQDGWPCLWALVNTEKKSVVRGFYVFGTGHPMDQGMSLVGEHVATFQQGPFVWHVFENALSQNT